MNKHTKKHDKREKETKAKTKKIRLNWMPWSMNVLTGADPRCPNVRVIGLHHATNSLLYKKYWKPPK